MQQNCRLEERFILSFFSQGKSKHCSTLTFLTRKDVLFVSLSGAVNALFNFHCERKDIPLQVTNLLTFEERFLDSRFPSYCTVYLPVLSRNNCNNGGRRRTKAQATGSLEKAARKTKATGSKAHIVEKETSEEKATCSRQVIQCLWRC